MSKKYSAQKELMAIFHAYPHQDLNSQAIFDIAKRENRFIPPAFNTHLSKLNQKGLIERTGRATYRLFIPEPVEPVTPSREPHKDQANLF